MFADAMLGARIDRAEARMCAHIASAQDAVACQAMVHTISGGLAIFAGPRSPVNKVIGLGFDTPLDLEALTEIEARWAERDEPVRIELSILTDPAISAALSARGYRLHGFENVLGRPLLDLPQEAAASSIAVEVLPEADWRTWMDIAIEAFANMDGTGSVADDALSREELERVMLPFAAVPGFIRYLARIDGEPAGEATLRTDDRLAQLAGSGTVPRFRGRGVQKALVQRRLRDARDAGCDLAVVTTAPGTRSQDNVMRRGFILLYTRAILING